MVFQAPPPAGGTLPLESESCTAPITSIKTTVETVQIDRNWPRWEGSATLDQSGVAVLVAAHGLDVAEPWLTHSVADLARRQDLVVVCGSSQPHAEHLAPYALTTRLREKLPRRSVIAVLISDHPDAGRHEFATIAGLLDDGAVTVAATLAADPLPVAAHLARHLKTHTFLRLDRDGYRRIPSARARA